MIRRVEPLRNELRSLEQSADVAKARSAEIDKVSLPPLLSIQSAAYQEESRESEQPIVSREGFSCEMQNCCYTLARHQLPPYQSLVVHHVSHSHV